MNQLLRTNLATGQYVDILAISCDSFNSETNAKIGRTDQSKGYDHIAQMKRIAEWCKKFDVYFKINTVVNVYNWEEDMNEQILQLNPVRWKVFQCLLIDGENAGENAIRKAETFVISEKQFQAFLARHERCSKVLVPEDNSSMRNSYIILDEQMRFLDNREGRKKPSASILEVGFEEAFKDAGFDSSMFLKRGGKYLWSKSQIMAMNTQPAVPQCGSGQNATPDW